MWGFVLFSPQGVFVRLTSQSYADITSSLGHNEDVVFALGGGGGGGCLLHPTSDKEETS